MRWPDPDAKTWQAARHDYEHSAISVQAIAARYKIRRKDLASRAAAHGWIRSMSGLDRADNKVVSSLHAQAKMASDPHVVRELLQDAITLRDGVVRRHQDTIRRGYDLVHALWRELADQSLSEDDVKNLAEIMAYARAAQIGDASVIDPDAIVQAMTKMLGLSQRIESATKLANATKTVIELERKVYGILDLDAAAREEEKRASNKPLTLTPNEAARRIAFALTLGLPSDSQT